MKKALKLFETFHQFEPTKIGEFGRSFRIPRSGFYVGEAKTMFYTSDKLNPTTGEDEGAIRYFHEHEGGVKMILIDGGHGGDQHSIPKWIRNVKALVRLGDCDGFEYEDFDGEIVKAKSTGRKPEWYTTPSGKALLIVQDKREVIAIAWGGTLDVEWRGVVG